MQVHRILGCGFLEAVYQDSLAIELAARGILYQEQVLLPVHYMGERVGAGYKADFLCFGSLIVEIKAQSSLDSSAIAQTVNYMRAAGHEVGLLLNFGAPSLEYRRLLVQPKHEVAQAASPPLPAPSDGIPQADSFPAIPGIPVCRNRPSHPTPPSP
jgi:GxxExxY protein